MIKPFFCIGNLREVLLVLFSMNHSYMLTAKTTQGVNNSLWFLHGMKEQL